MATGQKGKERPAKQVKGAAIQNSTPTRNVQAKSLLKKIVLVGLAIVDVVFIAALAYSLVHYIQQLKIIKHLNEFLDMAGDTWQNVCFQLIVATGLAIISGVGIEWFSKKKNIDKGKCIFVAVELLVFAICFIMVGFVLKTQAILTKYQENIAASKNRSVCQYQAANTPNTEEIPVELINYDFDNDPYVSSEKIDGYRGVLKGTTQKEGNELEQAARIIYKDIFTTFSMQTEVSTDELESYAEKAAMANAFHTEYIKMYENPPDNSIPEVEQFMRQERINVLKKGIDCREKADEIYKNAENRRMLAVHYIEEGDEHQAAGNIELAEECFEQSALWAMKALYLAIPGTDSAKMQECLDRLEIASARMSGINGSKSNELSRAVNIYQQIVELRMAQLQG